ncbi:MAG: DUF2304 domain-containing protein [Clostridium sp.]|nr:DUF2304 domain-containing protein [Clostridium sp.]
MTLRQKVLAVTVSIIILITIIDLVRKRKLREEFSWLWIATGVVILVLAIWYQLLEYITVFIGAVLPVSTLFFFGIVFLILISLHFSVKISELTTKVKDVSQRVAILDTYIDDLKKKIQ